MGELVEMHCREKKESIFNLKNNKSKIYEMPGIVVHICNHRLRKLRQEDGKIKTNKLKKQIVNHTVISRVRIVGWY